MKTIVETERLRLREFTLDDSAFIIALLNSAGWIEFIGDRHVKTTTAAITYLENGPLKIYKNHGFGLWMVEHKHNKKPMGMCGILKRDTLDFPDLGFCFLPEYFGKGYAYESATAAMLVARESFHIETICAITLANNTASIKLLERLGLQFISPISFPDNDETLLLYRN
jgi:RimJ/RimL family protein N-acetyltransferase